ncbi:MAG TPA: hypothetical protein VMT62_00375 [Syntrophorhabdaceae bacterium]|nr:hypothetical protein [Syntrophorhabdaceae bacterium]
MSHADGKLPLKAHKRIWIVFAAMLSIFVFLTVANEFLDWPHYIFGDQPTTYPQRKGEVILELSIYVIVILSSHYYFTRKIQKQIKILEGFIPICANCKKIRQDIDWKTLEEYISANSLARFSHSVCPDCIRILYAEHADRLFKTGQANVHNV